MMSGLSSHYLPGGHFSTLALFQFCPAALRPQLSHKQDRRRTDQTQVTATPGSERLGLEPLLTVVTVVVHQNDLFDQVRGAFLQDAEQRNGERGEHLSRHNETEEADGARIASLPDHSPQQSRASFIVEGDDDAGGRQVRLPLFMSAAARTRESTQIRSVRTQRAER